MKSVQLTADQCGYLLSSGYVPADLREALSDLSSEPLGVRRTLVLNAAIRERFKDVFTERLAQVGFDADYQLTSEGSLEELVDAFS